MLGTPDPTNISTIFPGSEHHMEHAMVGSSCRPLQLWVDKCVTSPHQDLQYNVLKHCRCLGHVKDTLPTSCPEMSPRDQSSPSRPSDLLILLMAPMFTPSCLSGIQRYHLIDATRRSVPSTGVQTANRWELLGDTSLSSLCDCYEVTCLASWMSHRRALATSGVPLRRLPTR